MRGTIIKTISETYRGVTRHVPASRLFLRGTNGRGSGLTQAPQQRATAHLRYLPDLGDDYRSLHELWSPNSNPARRPACRYQPGWTALNLAISRAAGSLYP